MTVILYVLLGLTVVAISAARVFSDKVLGGDTWWHLKEAKNRYALYNLLWVVAMIIGISVTPTPWWVGVILLLPVIAFCAWSISAAYDWDDTTNPGALMDRITWGAATGATKTHLKIRRFVGMGILGFLAIVWIAFAALGGHSDSNTDQAKDRGTASAPASPQGSPAAPKDSPSASPSINANCDVPADGISENAYNTTFTKNSVEVCVNGHWTTTQVKVGDKVQVVKWVQANGYEYDFISLDGKNVWTRTPYKP